MIVLGGIMPPVVGRYFDYINTEDWDGLRGIWTEDAIVSAVGARSRQRRDDIVDFYRKVFSPWAEHMDTPTRALVAGSSLAVEVLFTGRTTDGAHHELEAVDMIELDGDLIAKLTTWYDVAALRKRMAGDAAS